MSLNSKIPLINRRGETIYLRVQNAPSARKNATSVFLLHGYGDGMDTPLMKGLEAALLKQNYRVVSIDASHSFNDSDGALETHTPTKHWHDLEDVIAWAKGQSWFNAPYGLVGHSVGGLACLLHTQNIDKADSSIRFIAPIATATSGDALEDALKSGAPEMFQKFEARGYQWIHNEWNPKTEQKAKRKFEWLTDMKQYDVLPNAARMGIPLFLCSGTRDIPTPLLHQKRLLNAWGGDIKSHYPITGADHDFTRQAHRETLTRHFSDWLEALNAPKQKPKNKRHFKP